MNSKHSFVWMFLRVPVLLPATDRTVTCIFLYLRLCLKFCNCLHRQCGMGLEINWVWGAFLLVWGVLFIPQLAWWWEILYLMAQSKSLVIVRGNHGSAIICSAPSWVFFSLNILSRTCWTVLVWSSGFFWVTFSVSSESLPGIPKLSGLSYLMSFVMITVNVQIYLISGVEGSAAELQLCCFILPDLGKTFLRNGGKWRQQVFS